MNNDNGNFLVFRRWTNILCGLLLIVFGSFYFLFFNVSAQTEAVENPVEQNLVNGSLAFTSRRAGPTTPDGRVIIANADGSGQFVLPIPLALNPTEPAWSPDGIKLAFASIINGPQGFDIDIYVINANGSGQTNLTNTAFPITEGDPSWSATGKIAYERGGQIWTMNADGSGQTQFTAITQPSLSDPAWSPDGTKLAFTSGGRIWAINADGTNQRQITSNSTTKSDPEWSPDGTKIVSAGSSGITSVNVDGTNETVLFAGGSKPSWSPDGTKIAYRNGGIYTMDANGGNQVRIVADNILFPQCCDTIYDNPTWQPVAQTPNTFSISGRVTYNNQSVVGATINLSGTTNAAATTDAAGNYQFSGLSANGNYTVAPSFLRTYFTPANRSFNNLSANQIGNFEVSGVCQSGKCVKNGKIAFVRSGEIYTINSDGTNQTNITNNAASDGELNYSPSGTNIIFSTNRDGNNEIYRMDEQGSNLVRLTNNAASDFSPYYSPDGASIVFVSDRDGNSEIYKMNADGSNQLRLTNNTTNDAQPAFSPDGSKIIFVAFNTTQGTPTGLFTINADGSNPQPFPAPGGIVPFYNSPSYSPDGAKIIFTYTPDASTQIRVNWTMNADGTNPARFPADGSFGTYSPDGNSVAYTCCTFDNTNRLRISDALGSAGSVRVLTPSNTGNSLPDWQGFRIPRAPFDYDGDGRSDVSVFRPSNGSWYQLRSTTGFSAVQWGISTDVLTPADYDGDLKTDVAVWRPSDGNFYILNSFNNTVRIENFGVAGDVPTGGDFDGDGKADLAVYRGGANGTFYYRGSMGNPQGSISNIPWGISGDKSVAGDYDGDGRTDAGVFRPSNGTWYIRQSSNGQLSASNFGSANDALVPADYDGDGKTNPAVYRGGVWYVSRSSQGFTAFQFGVSNDIPAPADYDGDGRADAAIYRNGVWWILKSQTGAAEAVSFGLNGDKPIASTFVR